MRTTTITSFFLVVELGFPQERTSWKLEPPLIERTVRVKTLVEAKEAVTRPGTQVVFDADIDAAGEDGLVLSVNDIVIDGNGKTLANARRGVASEHEVLQRIEIRNLTLKDCGVGVFMRRDQHLHVHHNTVVGSKSVGMHFENSFGNHGRFFEVHDNTVRGGPKGGIVFQDGCTDGRVYDNVCIDGGYGPQSYANGCLNFDSNMIRVEIYGNRIEGGTFGLALRGQNNSGMHSCQIYGNSVSKARKAGIRICYETFRNVLRDNTVQDCPVALYYERAYKVYGNLLDGVTIRNCPLPLLVEGATTVPVEGRKPEPFADANVDRLVLKEWKPGAPIARISGGVKVHTIADAGPWYEGAVKVEGDAKVTWASFAHVTVLDSGKPVAGAEVTCEGLKGATGSDGRVRLGPFSSTEITQDGSRTIARSRTLNAAFRDKKAAATFVPDGSPKELTLDLK